MWTPPSSDDRALSSIKAQTQREVAEEITLVSPAKYTVAASAIPRWAVQYS
jgi:hypothetical protein